MKTQQPLPIVAGFCCKCRRHRTAANLVQIGTSWFLFCVRHTPAGEDVRQVQRLGLDVEWKFAKQLAWRSAQTLGKKKPPTKRRGAESR